MMSDSDDSPFDFPELRLIDRANLQQLHELCGREKAVEWLQKKTEVPVKYWVERTFDEETYWQRALEYYVDAEAQPSQEVKNGRKC